MNTQFINHPSLLYRGAYASPLGPWLRLGRQSSEEFAAQYYMQGVEKLFSQ